MASNINENTDEQKQREGSVELFEDLGSDQFMGLFLG